MCGVNYIARIRTKDNYWAEYPVYRPDTIVNGLETKTIIPEDIWAIVYDHGDSFYNNDNCVLVINEHKVSDEEMFKTGYVKVIGFRKEVIGVIEEKEYF